MMESESKFTGGLLELIGVGILTALWIVFTLGIGTPFATCYCQRWVASNTYIDGRQLEFTGTGGELWGQYIKWFLLTIITLGIYGLWLNIKLKQWIVSKTHVARLQSEQE